MAPNGAEVGKMKITKTDEMSITVMNMVALQWLRKTDPALIDIIRTEYSTDLKSGKQLANLVPIIAPNIDSLVSRYGSSSVHKVRVDDVADDTVEDEVEDSDVRYNRQDQRYQGRGRGQVKTHQSRGGFNNRFQSQASKFPFKEKSNNNFCPGCKKIAETQNVSIDFNHLPVKCPRRYVIRSIAEGFEDGDSNEEFGNFENKFENVVRNSSLQNEAPQRPTARVLFPSTSNPSKSFTIDIVINENKCEYKKDSTENAINKTITISEDETNWNLVQHTIQKIQGRKHLWNTSVRKEKSPTVTASVNGSKSSKVVIDEGSEINVIDYKFCLNSKIKFIPTSHAAKAAGNTTMAVIGQTKDEVDVKLLHSGSSVRWKLGKCIVVQTLGTNLLIGEPGKIDNRIFTDPINRCLQTLNLDGNTIVVKYAENDELDLQENSQTVEKEYNLTNKVIEDARTDFTDLEPPPNFNPDEDHTQDIKLDPDDQLSQGWKEKFQNVCSEFKDIFNPNPGRYNGFYGDIDCSLNFASVPPPSVRARIPSYPHDKLQLMGKLMDDMEQMGVLQTPEEAGVVPVFVVPSMLHPKAEPNQWRVVSDFTPLNIHLKKLPTVSPTINEAKQKLAKYKYNIELDLSNYFWQQGMKPSDKQYLGTMHPFKGLRVYAAEPQGLRNASEHGYERLARIFGDLCGTEKMTRMADGLYILADTLPELQQNFKEVLWRARNCGLTFKPKKVVIAPRFTTLFGWRKTDDGWRPLSHVISPLSRATLPSTAKQLRSYIGSYKQMAECIKNYAILLSPLEAAAAGKSSSTAIQWSEELKRKFEKSKSALNEIKTIYVPKPSDKLNIFTDYSKSEEAVGGELIITRSSKDGTTRKLLGGHFSAKLNKHQRNWWPCEGEALGVRLISQHFSPYIRENSNTTTIHTDNLPTVHAWKRLKTGAFSSSARVAAFLTGLSALTVEVVHTPGKDIPLSDYNSRHPTTCPDQNCQICQFASKWEIIGDRVLPMVGSVSVIEVLNGTVRMPFNQRAAWLKTQREDRAHRMLLELIKTSQLPEPKKTKGDMECIELGCLKCPRMDLSPLMLQIPSVIPTKRYLSLQDFSRG